MASLNGSVFITQFDKGAILTIGASVTPYSMTPSGPTQALGGTEGDRAVYAVAIPSVEGLAFLGGKVPVLFTEPEDVFQNYVLPCIVVKRSSISSAEDNAWGSTGYTRVPADGAVAKQVTLPNGTVVNGWSSYVMKPNARPFNLSYDIECRARTQTDGLRILNYMMKIMQSPGFSFQLVDTIGDVRTYDAMLESISDNSELSDIADRMSSWMLSITIKGELDLDADIDTGAVDPSKYTFKALTSLPVVGSKSLQTNGPYWQAFGK